MPRYPSHSRTAALAYLPVPRFPVRSIRGIQISHLLVLSLLRPFLTWPVVPNPLALSNIVAHLDDPSVQKLPLNAQPPAARLGTWVPASEGGHSPHIGSVLSSPHTGSMSAACTPLNAPGQSLPTMTSLHRYPSQSADFTSAVNDLDHLPPLPPRSGASRPRLVRSKSTIPKPFRLAGAKFHERALAELEEKRRQSEAVDSSPRIYRARPMPDFSRDPRMKPAG
jgi:hypothetical protein